jgi:hypothetical protein
MEIMFTLLKFKKAIIHMYGDCKIFTLDARAGELA